MKLLLTSNGLVNDSIQNALQDLCDKPFNKSRFIFIPTAANPEPNDKSWLANDIKNAHSLGWKNFDIVDIAALANLEKDAWWPRIEQADVILVGGGNTFYLSYWMQKTGLFAALPELLEHKVYVGISAGSIIASRTLRSTSQAISKFGQLVDEDYELLGPKGQSSEEALKFIEFAIRPHYKSKFFPNLGEEGLNKLAASIEVPLYALDDHSALQVVDGKIDVISEGEWKLYESSSKK